MLQMHCFQPFLEFSNMQLKVSSLSHKPPHRFLPITSLLLKIQLIRSYLWTFRAVDLHCEYINKEWLGPYFSLHVDRLNRVAVMYSYIQLMLDDERVVYIYSSTVESMCIYMYICMHTRLI